MKVWDLRFRVLVSDLRAQDLMRRDRLRAWGLMLRVQCLGIKR